jgi:hypothetical protein
MKAPLVPFLFREASLSVIARSVSDAAIHKVELTQWIAAEDLAMTTLHTE